MRHLDFVLKNDLPQKHKGVNPFLSASGNGTGCTLQWEINESRKNAFLGTFSAGSKKAFQFGSKQTIQIKTDRLQDAAKYSLEMRLMPDRRIQKPLSVFLTA